MLPELFDHQDQNVRASSKGLTLELCRWIGKESVKSILFEKMQDTMGPDMLGATICARMVNGSKANPFDSASDSGQGLALLVSIPHVKLRIWAHDIKSPCDPLDGERCRLTIPHAVLCR
ncbi:Protein MOR1 [Camellia lanceoleosa]|uniref:Protein MOR1 n=1 Tax=Camellia lanceoleosa TaxID=1840588 RepID=A0ACC0GXT0_9ERIC|nr:Protein MOR1 [Camellia lanceoleosa]